MKTFYATVVDINYVVRALSLYRSFKPWLGNKIFGFYCIDDAGARILETLDLPNAWVVPHQEFETQALKAVRAQRTINEYCWTCKAFALRHGLGSSTEFDWAVYLDSDMMAFGDPDAGLVSDPDANALITPHRYATPEFATQAEHSGIYNSGYAAFRDSPVGRRALQWWAERCLECCPSIPINGMYSDQKYFDRLPGLFEGVRRSPHKGLNTAPWNIEAYRTTRRGDRVCIDEDELLIYHFQSVRIYGTRLYELYAGHIKIPRAAVQYIYRPYVQNLRRSYEILRSWEPGFAHGIDPFLAKPKRVLTQMKRLMLGINNLAVV